MTLTKRVTYTNEDGFSFRSQPLEDTLTITKTATGYEVRYLTPDEYPDSPTENSDDADTGAIFLVHYHRDFDVRNDPFITINDVRRWYQGETIEQEKDYWIFPVAAYIHSGVVLALGEGRHFPDQQWDVSHVGAVLVKRDKDNGWHRQDKARRAAEALISEWNSHLSGDVYCLVKETYDQDKHPIDYDVCGGYVGRDYAVECLKREI